MFTGLSAFPLTPIDEQRIDEDVFARLVDRLAAASVDSITVLGSTGSYMYLSTEERARVARTAVRHAGGVPVLVGIGALRTKQVLRHAEDAQQAGAAGVLLAPVTYQTLTDDDVYGLFEDVTANLSVPLVVYDNPGTTHVTFTDDLYAAIARLPRVASFKLPGVPEDAGQARARITQLRQRLPAEVTLGVSGDAFGAPGLDAGCDVWYSVIAGTLPEPALAITRAAQAGDRDRAAALSEALRPLWELFARHGSLRVVAAIAEQFGLVDRPSLPLPIRGLSAEDRTEVRSVLHQLDLAG